MTLMEAVSILLACADLVSLKHPVIQASDLFKVLQLDSIFTALVLFFARCLYFNAQAEKLIKALILTVYVFFFFFFKPGVLPLMTEMIHVSGLRFRWFLRIYF